MTQSEHDPMCIDPGYKKVLDYESDRIGKQRIKEAFERNDWMYPDEFGKYLKSEIRKIWCIGQLPIYMKTK